MRARSSNLRHFAFAVVTAFLLPAAVQAVPISWDSSWHGGNQLLSQSQTLTIRLELDGGFDPALDVVHGFDVSWDLIDDEPDIFRYLITVPYTYSCGPFGRTCTGYSSYVQTYAGEYERALITGVGHSSGLFEVGNTCSGSACGASNSLTTYSFGDTLLGIDSLQHNGYIDLQLTAYNGDFFVGTARLSAFGQRLAPSSSSAPVPEPATVLLMGAGLLGIPALRRRLRQVRNERAVRLAS